MSTGFSKLTELKLSISNAEIMFQDLIASLKAANEEALVEISQLETNLNQQTAAFMREKDAHTQALALREQQVANRENAVGQIREVAAARKAEIETLTRAVETLNKQRIEAEARARTATQEKERLEGVCATLLAEKQKLVKELMEQLPEGTV